MSDKFLSDTLVERYKNVDRLKIAKEIGVTPKWVRDVLGGREMITGDAAIKIIAKAQSMIKKKR